jgi:hypothetical protein
MKSETSISELKARRTIPEAWAALNLSGEPGKSCKSPFREDQRPSFSVYEDGHRFKDHATGEAGDVLDFVKLALQCDTKGAVQWLRERDGNGPTVPTGRPAPRPTPTGTQARWPQLQPGSGAEIAALAALRSLPVEALELAAQRGFLWFCDFAKQRAWAITDQARRCVELRTMSGKPWPAYGDLPERKSHAIGEKQTPLGLLEMAAFPHVLLLEGVGDLLAAFAVIQNEGRVADVAPVACLGATVRLAPAVAAHFATKRVRIVPQLDEPGQGAAQEWAVSLRHAGAQVDAFSLEGIVDRAGQGIKDLGDVFAKASPESIRANPLVMEVCP